MSGPVDRLDEARGVLGAGRGETLRTAAERVRAELEQANDTIKAAQDALSARPGESLVVTACRMRDRLAAECQASRTLADRLAAAHELLGGAREEDVLDAARRVMAERGEARQQSSAFAADGTMRVVTGDGKTEWLADVSRARDRLTDLSKAARGILLSHTGKDLDEAMDVEDVAVAVAAEIMRARRILGALECETLSEGARRPVRERDEAHADISAARDILGTPPGETLRAAVTRLRDQSDMAARSGRSLADRLEAVRDALGVVAGDVVDAAQRVAADRDAARAEADAARKAAAEADFLQAERDAIAAKFTEARVILGAADGQPLAVRARDLMAQLELMDEAARETPTMVFQAGISVVVGRDGFGGEAYAQVRVTHITDPMFLALSGRQYARLALCVVPEAVS
jgi:hypothetical protein